ncbi:hypothetical protein ACP70R_003287 [Stipagrostis hirtigluma subsp. patula]
MTDTLVYAYEVTLYTDTTQTHRLLLYARLPDYHSDTYRSTCQQNLVRIHPALVEGKGLDALSLDDSPIGFPHKIVDVCLSSNLFPTVLRRFHPGLSSRSALLPHHMGRIKTSPAPAPQPPRPTMRVESRCCPQTSRGTISFEITGYRLHRDLRKFICSSSVQVGGYNWCLHYFPDGDIREESRGHAGVFLVLLSQKVKVRVLTEFSLVDQTTGSLSSIYSDSMPIWFNTLDDGIEKRSSWGLHQNKFLKRSELEASSYLRDDRLVIECDITVIKDPLLVETASSKMIGVVPHRTLSQDLANLLETRDGADVTFEVQGDVVTAHSIVLATRSPVFKAEFYGPLRRHGSEHHVTIEDMEPAVFKALLHFIYTDSISCMDGLGKEEKKELTKHLLVAADRYDVRGLKFLCEKNLCESLDVETVALMLALADQYSCSELKRTCVEFITCSDRLKEVAASEGYGHVKANCPAVLVDVLEKAAKIRKN